MLRVLLFVVSLVPYALFPLGLSDEETRVKQLIENVRKSGFSDYEIDEMHKTIADNLKAIRIFTDKGYDKQNAKYLEDTVKTDLPDLFKTDTQGKKYLDFDMELGESFGDYPKTYLFQSKVYVYLAADLSVEKVIIQYKRTNSSGSNFIREMRRIINPTPKPSVIDAAGNVVADDNSDITLEYYTSNDGPSNWADIPDLKENPAMTLVLNEKENPVSYFKQRMILEKYRQALRHVNQVVAKQLYLLQLDRKRMVSKMLDLK